MNTSMLVTGLLALIAVLTVIVLLVRKDVLNLGLIVKQVTSGRWLLTVTAGLCMLIAMATDAWIAIKSVSANPSVTLPFPVSTIFSIMTGVFTFYFLKEQAANTTANTAPSAENDVEIEKAVRLLAERFGLKQPVVAEQTKLDHQIESPK